jgi:Domain of unknown function (DUF4919)
MRRGVTAASLILLAGSVMGCQSFASAPVKQAMTAQMQRTDPASVDFARLRAEFGGRSDFVAICERDRPLHRLAESARQQDWKDVVAASEPWLKQCPVDIDAHLIRAIALKEIGRVAESDDHVDWVRGLVDSVLTSGDGRTPQTAFVVISVAEEYSMLRVLRVRPIRHAILSGGVDELFVKGDDGVAGVIYFNPAAHVRRLGERPDAAR